MSEPTRFKITWSDGRYLVSIPNYNGGEVVDAAIADTLVQALEAANGYLLNARIDLQTGCTKATAIRTIDGGLKLVREALAKVSACLVK